MSNPKILSQDELVAVRARLQEQGKVVVQCHGCFDIVHPGHIHYLKFAREQGDVLIVSVSGDQQVDKGADRPYIPEELRLENLAALELVDYVCLDHNDWAGPVLERLRPDVYVKGREYEQKADPRFARERQIVEGYGGKIIFSSGDVVYSSTYILEQFRERFPLRHSKVESFCRRNSITRPKLDELLRAGAGLRVLVLGDPVLDHYIHCDAQGIAAESPILTVSPLREDWFLGAGALIARQLLAFGAEASFVTPLNQSDASRQFRTQLADAGVEVIAIEDDARPTYVKTRYLVEARKILKVNVGRYAPLSTIATEHVIKTLRARLPEFDAMVVLDFGYGMFGRTLTDAVSALSRELGKPYFIDVSGATRANIRKFKGPRLATPTEEELRVAFSDSESGISNLALRYFRETGAGDLVTTMGKRGAVLFAPPIQGAHRLVTDYLPSLAHIPLDTVGAGDVFLTTTCLTALSGRPLAMGVYLASAVAAVHMQHLGNDPVSVVDIERFLDGRPELHPVE
ncbi:MAG: adenylyltransferase/cytidyltransferase family protein, partial [Myxococcales bacterium]|nr:adenylyltransferase/cytidyltransferase family protein [Myxococcales bacterium]